MHTLKTLKNGFNLSKEQVVRALRGTPSNENSSKKVKGVLLEAVTGGVL